MLMGGHRQEKSSKATLLLASMIGLAGCSQTSSNKTVNASTEASAEKTEIHQNLASTPSVTATTPSTTTLPTSSNAITSRTVASAVTVSQPTLLSATSSTDNRNNLARPETNLAVFPTTVDKNKPTVSEKSTLTQKIFDIPNATPLQQAYLAIIRTMQLKMITSSDEADKEFAKNMLAHHQAAISLAKLELKYGKDETLLRLAQDTATAQQTEIDILKQWLKNPPDTKKSNNSLVKAMQADYEQNAQDMTGAMVKGVSANTADMMFALTLLPHHKGALAMAETELKFGKDKAMRQMAISMISSQQGEITLMKNWLASQHKRQ